MTSASRTALMAAAARAAHLIVDGSPSIFADTLAQSLLGEQADELIAYHRLHGDHVVLRGARAIATTRSRYTEDRFGDAVSRGTRQYVILGAGLDSFAYRSALAKAARVFEVDHPAGQDDKRRRVSAAGAEALGDVSFVPVDFEADSLHQRLVESGFDTSMPAVVSWLGVILYLTREAIAETLAVVGGLAPGTELVAEYMLPTELRDPDGQTYFDSVSSASAEQGEPWLSLLAPEELTGMLRSSGFASVEHIAMRDAVPAELWRRTDVLRPHDIQRLAAARIG